MIVHLKKEPKLGDLRKRQYFCLFPMKVKIKYDDDYAKAYVWLEKIWVYEEYNQSFYCDYNKDVRYWYPIYYSLEEPKNYITPE